MIHRSWFFFVHIYVCLTHPSQALWICVFACSVRNVNSEIGEMMANVVRYNKILSVRVNSQFIIHTRLRIEQQTEIKLPFHMIRWFFAIFVQEFLRFFLALLLRRPQSHRLKMWLLAFSIFHMWHMVVNFSGTSKIIRNSLRAVGNYYRKYKTEWIFFNCFWLCKPSYHH